MVRRWTFPRRARSQLPGILCSPQPLWSPVGLEHSLVCQPALGPPTRCFTRQSHRGFGCDSERVRWGKLTRSAGVSARTRHHFAVTPQVASKPQSIGGGGWGGASFNHKSRLSITLLAV